MRESINNPCFQHLKEYLSFIASHKEKWNCSKLPLTGMRGREEITMSAFLCEHADVTASSRLTACAPFFVLSVHIKTAHSVTVLLECL